MLDTFTFRTCGLCAHLTVKLYDMSLAFNVTFDTSVIIHL